MKNYSSKSRNKKTGEILWALIFFVSGIISVYFFWKNMIFLSLLLIGLSVIKNKIIPIKKELETYIISGLIGSLGESFIMLNGVWEYFEPHIFNFPVWLPLLWGLAGITGISLYQGLIKENNHF